MTTSRKRAAGLVSGRSDRQVRPTVRSAPAAPIATPTPVEVAGRVRDVAFPGVVPLLGPRSVPLRHVGPDLGADTHAVLAALPGVACTCRTCTPG